MPSRPSLELRSAAVGLPRLDLQSELEPKAPRSRSSRVIADTPPEESFDRPTKLAQN
jgi:hypothetical protein